MRQNIFGHFRSNREAKLFYLLYFIFAVTLIGFLGYNTFLKDIILKAFLDTSDNSDIQYYTIIFQNLNYPFAAVIILLGLSLSLKGSLIRWSGSILKNDNLIFWIIGLVIISQTTCIFLFNNKPFADSVYYLDHAKRLLETGSYINQNGVLTAFWPAGYPVYLAFIEYIFGNDLIILKLFNVLFSIGLILSLYWLFKKILSTTQLNILLLITCLYPGFILNSNIIMPDYISAALLWFSIFFIIKKPYRTVDLIFAGIILSFSTLIRPTHFLLPILFIMIIYFQKERVKKSLSVALFLTSFLILITPWLIRNYNLYGTFPVIATNGGYNFLMGNHNSSAGKVNFDFEYNINNQDEVSEESKAYSSGWESIKDNPLMAIVRSAKKLFYSYYRGDSSVTWIFKGERNEYNPLVLSSAFFISNYIHWLVIFLSLFGFKTLFKLLKENKMLFLFGFLFYFLVIIMIFVGNERYIISILPIHFLSAALFIQR